jgi:hypothetical protein
MGKAPNPSPQAGVSMPKTANRNGYASRVNILKYVKVANKWRFAPAQLVNGKLKFDWVLIDGQAERHT